MGNNGMGGLNAKRGLVTSIAVAILLLSVAVMSGQAVAVSRSTTRTYFVGADPLCTIFPDLPPEVACPAVAMADNGDTVWLDGVGTFNPASKEATGGGSFTHKNAAGDVVGMGTWMAVRVLGFKSYGTLEFPGVGTIEGGLVLLRVHLVGAGGAVQLDAILQIDCLVGNPPAGAIEGIRLSLQDVDLNFNKEVQGLTVYIPA